jgi:hypothetical protein
MFGGYEQRQATNLLSIAGPAQLRRREVYVEYRCKKSDTPTLAEIREAMRYRQ